MITLLCFAAELEQRTLEAILLQILNNPPRGNSVQQLENLFQLAVRIYESVNVIGHDNVGKNKNAVILSDFPLRIADHLF